jgi:hypothetical protein
MPARRGGGLEPGGPFHATVPDMSGSSDDEELRRIISEKRRSGLLPPLPTLRAWAGRGSGATCVLCEFPIETGQIEYEVEWQAAADIQLLRFHELCYRLWTEP